MRFFKTKVWTIVSIENYELFPEEAKSYLLSSYSKKLLIMWPFLLPPVGIWTRPTFLWFISKFISALKIRFFGHFWFLPSTRPNYPATRFFGNFFSGILTLLLMAKRGIKMHDYGEIHFRLFFRHSAFWVSI